MISKLTKSQTKQFTKKISQDGYACTITATIRYDDNCGNGHNSFAITGVVARGIYADANKAPDRKWQQCGCIHDDIKKHFPELEKFLKWHFMNSDGPWGYIANTLYHVSEKDCWGKLAGEPYQNELSIVFGDNPINHSPTQKLVNWLHDMGTNAFKYLATESIDHDKDSDTFSRKYSFRGFCKLWHECPFDSLAETEDFLHALQNCSPVFLSKPTRWGKGKPRDLPAARSSALWPNATVEQLSDKEALNKRLPALLKRFQKDLAELNLVY